MSLGFIIIRHVNSKMSDLYWKECYTCIRKFYDNPIMIIDDSSNPDFLNENIFLKNCSVIYDKDHKGAAELLPYYYFYKVKPFDTAVIIHDSIFIQSKINFELTENEDIKFLWTFSQRWNNDIFYVIDNLIQDLPYYDELLKLYNKTDSWFGAFGCMSVLRWNFIETLQKNHSIFDIMLPKVSKRENRYGLERVLALLAHYNTKNISTIFGDIHSYIRWGITFTEYLKDDYSSYPIMKVWSSR